MLYSSSAYFGFWLQLALLLHQELNSSPRVPRVPRVRHVGSLPQLSSASATSMLIKRTSSSGGKDQHTVRHFFLVLSLLMMFSNYADADDGFSFFSLIQSIDPVATILLVFEEKK